MSQNLAIDSSRILGRLAQWIFDHAKNVAVMALMVTAFCGVVGATLLSLTSNEIGDPAAQSARAAARITTASGTGASPDDIVLIVDLPEAWPSPKDQQLMLTAAERLERVAGVLTVVLPDGSNTPQLVARDQRSVLITAGLSAAADHDSVAASVRNVFAADPAIAVGGSAAVSLDIDERISHDLEWAEIFAFPILLVLATWIFRGMVAAIIPLLVGGLCITATLAGLRGVAEFLSLSQYVLNLVIGLGLGLAIDYCLFMISRYREEILIDGYGVAAVIRTVQRAGRAILLSALTVACALATLMLFPQKFLYSMGIGGVLVTVTAALGAVVLVPALLVILGPRINALSPARWRSALARESSDVKSGSWYRLSRWVMGHAPVVLLGSLVVVALLAFPALYTKFGNVDQTSLPTSSVPRQVSDRIASGFPGGGGGSIYLAVTAGESAQNQVGALNAIALRSAGTGALMAAEPRYVGSDVWVLSLALPGSPFSTDAGDAVDRIRAIDASLPFLVGGDAADFVDLESSVGAHLKSVLLIVALAVMVVMFLVTGSVVLAVKTLVLNVLNVAMTFGVLVWIFQFGHLEWLLRFQSVNRIDLTQPILVAVIAFGLSTDYGVFLFARIREAHDQGLDDVEAVSTGIGRSGRIISSAALLLAVAIGAFSSSSVLFIKELGVGAAVAVLLDATLVRAFLVPSAMKLMRSINWWAPPVLLRVHAGIAVREGAVHE